MFCPNKPTVHVASRDGSTLMTGFSIGGYIFVNLTHDRVLDFADIVTILALAGIAAGSTTALNSKPRLALVYLVGVICVPMVSAKWFAQGH